MSFTAFVCLMVVSLGLTYGIMEYCRIIIDKKAFEKAGNCVSDLYNHGYLKFFDPNTNEEITIKQCMDLLEEEQSRIEETNIQGA